MASQAQIEANRLNAQLSTGPSSLEGKAASRFNALKHGVDASALVLPGEDPAAREELANSYFDRYDPQSPDEVFLVETIIQADWITRRLDRLEAQVFTSLITRQDTSANPLAAAFEEDAKGANLLQKIFRRQQAAKADWQKALNALRQLIRERTPAEPTQTRDPLALLQQIEANLPPLPDPATPPPPRRPPVPKKFWRR